MEIQKNEIMFNGGLPEVPFVVGLLGKIPDGVNNLIARFLGFKPHPVARALVAKFWQWFGRYSNVAEKRIFNSRSYLPNHDEVLIGSAWNNKWWWQEWQKFSEEYLLERCRWKRPQSIRKSFEGYWSEKIRRAKKAERELIRLRFGRLPEKYQRQFLGTDAGKKLFNLN